MAWEIKNAPKTEPLEVVIKKIVGFFVKFICKLLLLKQCCSNISGIAEIKEQMRGKMMLGEMRRSRWGSIGVGGDFM